MEVGLEISTSSILGNEVLEKPKQKALMNIKDDIVKAISNNRKTCVEAF